MIAQVGHARAAAPRAPAPARARIAFHSALVAIPQFHIGILPQHHQPLEESLALSFILPLGPALRHAQVVIELVKGMIFLGKRGQGFLVLFSCWC